MAKIVNPETWESETESMDFEQKGIYVQQLVNQYIQRRNKKANRAPKKPNEFTPPTQEEVILYFVENGYTRDSAIKFHNYYSSGAPPWYDSIGHPIRSWKQKAQAVWFTEKNKEQTERRIAR